MEDLESMGGHEMLMLHRMPAPETYPCTAHERCPDLLREWLALNPDATPAPRDHEDWAEPAAVLVAMSKAGPVVRLPPAAQLRTTGDRTPAPPAAPGNPSAIMWGLFSDADAHEFPVEADLLWNARHLSQTVQDYASSPVFLRHAGRGFHVCDVDRAQIGEALLRLVRSGAARGFVKSRDKGFAYPFPLASEGLGEPTAASLFELMDGPRMDFSYSTMHREGDRSCIYVQEAFSPTREYRVIVVGDRVVSGAGCIEAMTPAESEGAFFDDRMEVVRGDGDVVRDPDTAARYVEFARAYAADWAAEHGASCGYSLDLSVDAVTGRVLPVEMNPLLNVGLYANDADRLVAAMLGREPEAAGS